MKGNSINTVTILNFMINNKIIIINMSLQICLLAFKKYLYNKNMCLFQL